MYSNSLIFGKDPTTHIVGLEYYPTHTSNAVIFREVEGELIAERRYLPFFILASSQITPKFQRMAGSNYYCWLYETYDFSEIHQLKRKFGKYENVIYTINDIQENLMCYNGITFFKGMKSLNDISVMSIDLETTGLNPSDSDARILLCSVTSRKNKKIIKDLFRYDAYQSEKEMLEVLANYIHLINPSNIIGHNIYKFDLDYLIKRARLTGANFNIGRDKKEAIIVPWTSQFRKDQITSYEYHQVKIFGRSIVDTWFQSIRFDMFSKKYDSYGLKQIIEVEENAGKIPKNESRSFYDAKKIRFNYQDPVEWEKIQNYCRDDADDALKLYDMMCKTQFLVALHVPKPFQKLLVSATGSQVNSIIERRYLEDKHSIPLPSPKESYEGAISFGNSGIYNNTFKIDVASLYPSIMLQFEIYPEGKDVNKYFLQMVDYFTTERLKNKKLYEQTDDPWYYLLQEVQKIFINSAYGFLGTAGLPFNFMKGAAEVTRHGREIIQKTLKWAESKRFKIANADTDSILVTKEDNSIFTEKEQDDLLNEINSLMLPKIKFAHDGVFPIAIIFASKNYILKKWNKKKNQFEIIYKGSALKAPMLEAKLRGFLKDAVNLMLENKVDAIPSTYQSLVSEIYNLNSIEGFTFKVPLTPKKMDYESDHPSAKKVQRLIERHKLEVNVSDKLNCFYLEDGELELAEYFTGACDRVRLIEKLWNTSKRFENLLPCKEYFPKYHLKIMQGQLKGIACADLDGGACTDLG